MKLLNSIQYMDFCLVHYSYSKLLKLSFFVYLLYLSFVAAVSPLVLEQFRERVAFGSRGV